jgi:hypothetical protein
MERYHCETVANINYPAGTRPPELFAYPKPSGPIRLVFIGWNPPKPFGGFWSLDSEDHLRTCIHEILTNTKEIIAERPDDVFLNEFLSKGFFFLHAVKCWTSAKFPGFGRKARIKDRDNLGLPLLRACAGTHLRAELEGLKPEKVCALGQVPYLGLCHAFKIDERFVDLFSPTEGRVFEPSTTGLGWPLLYTCFPQPNVVTIRGKSERIAAKELTRRHLERFL